MWRSHLCEVDSQFQVVYRPLKARYVAPSDHSIRKDDADDCGMLNDLQPSVPEAPVSRILVGGVMLERVDPPRLNFSVADFRMGAEGDDRRSF
jgi:hypothetical protein